MVKVLIKKLDQKVKLPEYKTDGASGMDIIAFLNKPINIKSNLNLYDFIISKMGFEIKLPQRERTKLFYGNLNKRFNKQVPAFKAGGRAGKMGGGMMMQKPMMKKGGDVKKIEKAFGSKKKKKNLKKVDSKKNPGLAKLPTQVRNKMGFMKKGGAVK